MQTRKLWVVAAFSSVSLLGCASLPAVDSHPVSIRDFESLDRDQDGYIENLEWDYGFAESGILEFWDRNSDFQVDPEEWETGPLDWYAEDVGYWYDWDWNENRRLERREFANALFEAWDDDDDRRIDGGEFDSGVSAL
jgi:hypothetical protein